jgi:hypothetical protein
MRIVSLLIYLGIGAMCHALFLGARFHFNDAWTYAWLLGWPIMLFWSIAFYILAFGAVAFIAISLWTSLLGGEHSE